MSQTNFVHRILLIVPVAKVAAVVTWFQVNVGANAVDTGLGPGLSATGAAPATHNWMSGSFIDNDCKAILAKLCQLASVTPPTGPTWNGWTQVEKIAWLLTVQAAILSGYGAFVTLSDNTGIWSDSSTALSTMGLLRI